MELFKLFGRIVLDNSEANDGIDETTDKAQKSQPKISAAFEKIGTAAVKVGKVMATGLAAGSAAIGALAKQSLDSYADYEQLVGGVETLFKDSAMIVQGYADAAYETAGLSANEYMETVTSFSASLLQGLGGDTEKAAEVANRAITDMSDNANKMGTSMSMIQNAYQGFAKQNYTMLDNLKLGYGGTQAEMARLINDSGVLGDSMVVTAETVNQVSFDKIIEAIGVVQDRMGITGTTAKEASGTISGSVASMKAQWENLLTAFAGDGWDIGVFVSNFVDAAITAMNNIVPRIAQILSGISDALPQVMTVISAELPGLIESLLPGVIDGAIALIKGVVAALPGVIAILIGVLPTLIDAVKTIVNGLVGALPQIIEALVSALPTLIPMLVDAIVSMIVTICTVLPQIIQPIIDYLPDIIISIVDTLMTNLPALIDGVISLVLGIVAALPQIIQALVDALPMVIETIVTCLLNLVPDLIKGAIQLVAGIVVALPQILAALISALPAAFTGIWNGIKNVFSGAGEWFGNIFTKAKDKIATAFSNIKEKLSAPFEKARDLIKGIADKIFGFFKGTISMPKIKMPHFGISPSGWKIGDLLKGTIPKLSIQWYAQAMDNPMIMTKPTIFGYDGSTGQLMGGGEAGSEVVSGTNTLMNMIQAAVAGQNNALVYHLENLVDILASYFPQILAGMDKAVVLDSGAMVGALAVPMNQALGRISERKDRGR